MSVKKFEVAVVGAGIIGSATAYVLSRYTDIKDIAIIEKYEGIGGLNSSATGNSQTNHLGEIETNFSLKKALKTKKMGEMIELYCKQYGYENEIIFSFQKMVLGVGEQDIDLITKRYESFLPHFTQLELWNKKQIKELEPMVVLDQNKNERKENIIAMGSKQQWSAVNYGKLSKSFIENAIGQRKKNIELFLKFPVVKIKEKKDGGFLIKSKKHTIEANYVLVNAGAHSLYLAHKMGYGLKYGCLPIAGSFYISKKKILNGKVYTVQNNKLPFAALHGDLDVSTDNLTRFGPTAVITPKLERHKSGTYIDFWKSLNLDYSIIKILFNLLSDKDIRDFMIKNAVYGMPLIGKRLFVDNVRKIIPSIKFSDIDYAKGFGGIRPQTLDKEEKKLIVGESCIETDKGILFNMVPSPGATSCLGIGLKNTKNITNFLGKTFYEDKFNTELVY